MASRAFSTINLQLQNLPNELKDAETYAEFVKIYNACKILAQAVDTYTGIGTYSPSDWSQVGNSAILLQNQTKIYPIFDDTVTVGQLVSLYDVAGVPHVRKAIAVSTDLRPCHGFATAAVTAGNRGEVVLQGLYPYATGLTTGARLFLSNGTYGAFTTTTPSGTGNIRQAIGYALSPSSIFFNPTVDYTTL